MSHRRVGKVSKMAPLRCLWLLFLAAGAIATDPEDSEDCGLNYCIPGSSAVVFAFREHAHRQVFCTQYFWR